MAIRFDASGDDLVITANLLDYNKPYTVTGWCRFNSIGGWSWATFFSAYESASNYDVIQFEENDGSGNPYLAVGVDVGGSTSSSTGALQLAANTWYYLSLVRESATALKAFLNCGQQGSTLTANVASRTALTSMRMGRVNSSGGDALNGAVDRVRIYRRALTVSELRAEMYLARAATERLIYGDYPMWPGSGLRAIDYSGQNHTWTQTGTLTDEVGPAIRIMPRVWPVVWQADSATAQTASDTTTLTDTSALAAAASATDAGTLSDASALVATASKTDTLTVSDASALTAVVTANDSVALTETSAASTALPVIDSATLSEMTTLASSALTSDSGTLGEVTALAAVTSATDAISLSEAATLSAQIQAIDTSSLSEISTLNAAGAFAVSDTLTLTETASLLVQVVSTETATLNETSGLMLSTSIFDLISLTDVAVMNATATATDSVLLTDSAGVDTGLVGLGAQIRAVATGRQVAGQDADQIIGQTEGRLQ